MGFVALFAQVIGPWLFTDHQANDDLRDQQEDGTKNSLGKEYHDKGWRFRALVLGGYGLVIMVLNWCDLRVWAWPEFIGYCFYAAGVFAYDFSPRLNRWRMLFFPDYKHLHKWYVSREEGASDWDKALVKHAPRFGLTPEQLLQRVAWLSLIGGTAVFIASIWLSWF